MYQLGVEIIPLGITREQELKSILSFGHYNLSQRQATLSCEGPNSQYFLLSRPDSLCHHPQLCHCERKAATDETQMNGCGCVPMHILKQPRGHFRCNLQRILVLKGNFCTPICHHCTKTSKALLSIHYVPGNSLRTLHVTFWFILTTIT